MKLEMTCRSYQLDETTRAYAERKLSKLDRYLEDPTDARLTLSLDGHQNVAELHVAHRFGILQASEATDAMRDSIHAVAEKAERQARRGRRRAHDRWRRAGRSGGVQWSGDERGQEGAGEGT